MFNDPRDNNTGGNAAAAFDKMSVRNQAYLVTIIRLFLRPAKAINRKHTSYGLKHYAEKLMPDGYVSNGEMKGAMLYCGYKAADTDFINWRFNTSDKSELYLVNRMEHDSISNLLQEAVDAEISGVGYDYDAALGRCNGCAFGEVPPDPIITFFYWAIESSLFRNDWYGDLARDMNEDKEFPRIDNRAAILSHLRCKHATPDAIAAFNGAWKQYRSRRRYGE